MRTINLAGYLAIPFAFIVHFWLGHGKGWEPAATFFLAALGVVPLAALMGDATEHLAQRAGPTWGGLLNATFGNAAELIIGVIALAKGLNDVVKASLTGSILGNLLLVGGLAMLVGGWRREKQKFNRASAEINAGLLVIAVAAMLFPAIFHFTGEKLLDPKLVEHERSVSIGTSLILIAVYVLGLLFTLKTHAHLFSRRLSEASPGAAKAAAHGAGWPVRKSVVLLLVASAGIGIVAELLVGSAAAMARSFGWNPVFVGVVLLAIIGNAAEHSSAILLARRDDMDTAMAVAYQSSIQIALFATPVLVFASMLVAAAGAPPAQVLDLVFSPIEVVARALTVGVVAVLCQNGETNWFEGILLLALYAILGISFFFLPA